MRVVLSVDMEGVSQLVEPNEIIACCDEYWATGKPRLEADVAAACRGLLAGGADEVVVLDNHASGNTYNVWPDALPSGARLEEREEARARDDGDAERGGARVGDVLEDETAGGGAGCDVDGARGGVGA